MANHNGRTQRDETIEHGYQDWRDQHDRAHGRDDFRGLDRNTSNDPMRGMRGDNRNGDRYNPGSSGMGDGGRDPFAERDRDLYGDRAEGNARGSGGSLERGAMGGDYQRGSGYGYDDGNPSRERTSYRGQSGAQAGGTYGNQNANGGNRGQWGDFDRGGRYARAGASVHDDTQSPRDGTPGARDMQRGPHAGKGPQGFQRSDERIQEMVHEALTDHDHLDATNITVAVKDGEVTLTGTVEDRRTKRLAEDVVADVKGVKDVQNQLRVQSRVS
jgi:osmotically-inducible protein OsmY